MTPSIIRVTLLALGLLLLPIAAGTPVWAQDTITREQADTLIKEIRELRQAIDRLRAPRAAERPPDEKVRVPLNAPMVLGRADAPVTLVEFTDLECPFCRSFHVGAFEKIKQTYIDSGKVRFVSFDFPLDIHPNARPAAVAVRCAGEQGKFWEMRHLVTVNAATLSREKYVELAKGLGLDTGKLDQCIDADRYKADIDRDMAEGLKLGVNGTPTFFVGKTAPDGIEGQRIVGAQPFPAFEAQIKALLGER
jgi:protein-disulfide isomerase